AMRAGDLSGISASLVDPFSGSAFAGNQIPADRISAQTLSLLQFIPLPNLSGTTRNYHFTTTTQSVSDAANLRITHNFIGTAPAGRRGGGGGGGARGGGRGGRG